MILNKLENYESIAIGTSHEWVDSERVTHTLSFPLITTFTLYAGFRVVLQQRPFEAIIIIFIFLKDLYLRNESSIGGTRYTRFSQHANNTMLVKPRSANENTVCTLKPTTTMKFGNDSKRVSLCLNISCFLFCFVFAASFEDFVVWFNSNRHRRITTESLIMWFTSRDVPSEDTYVLTVPEWFKNHLNFERTLITHHHMSSPVEFSLSPGKQREVNGTCISPEHWETCMKENPFTLEQLKKQSFLL